MKLLLNNKRIISSTLMAQAFVSILRSSSRSLSSPRWAARAFCGVSNNFGFTPRSFLAKPSSTLEQQRVNHRFFSVDTTVSATVEEDLDSALDDFVTESAHDADEGGTSSSIRPKITIDKNEPKDYNDPQFLSITNPRWVEAGLDHRIRDILSEKGIVRFTPVQGEAFDPVLAGRDVIGRSRTGTGKTLAFGLPGMTRIAKLAQEKGNIDPSGNRRRGRYPSMLILCPTRELSRQVQEELSKIARPLDLITEVFHGGVSYDPQERNLRNGIDVLVGTPGRLIDHLDRGRLNLSECDIVVLDEADEMLNMGFAEDVEVLLNGIGSANKHKTQCLLFSATTPSWVRQIAAKYQDNVLQIDSTGESVARTATTVRHLAVQLPEGRDAKQSSLEDIIAIEISKEMKDLGSTETSDEDIDEAENPIAAAAIKKKRESNHAMQQKIFGKTIVFTETKREADELVSGAIFKSLTAQALHGDVGQKQRDATLSAFRTGAFNVLVATDVAARGIDISDVDLVIQFDPPRDADTYVHRSGRTGRAGRSGVSILLFTPAQAKDIVRIERSLGHGFKFELTGPPSIEAALRAAAKTSAVASRGIPEETAQYFRDAAMQLLSAGEPAEDVVARCLAAISRRATQIQSRSLLTGELGMVTVQMTNTRGRPVTTRDVMFTVGKLSRMSQTDEKHVFDSDVGKIQVNDDGKLAIFDMSLEDAKNLMEFSKDIDAGGARFEILKELSIERDASFGREPRRFGRFDDRGGRGRGGRRFEGRGGGRGYRSFRSDDYGRQRGGDRYGGGGDRYGGGGGGNRYGGGGGDRYGDRRGERFSDRQRGRSSSFQTRNTSSGSYGGGRSYSSRGNNYDDGQSNSRGRRGDSDGW